MKSKQVFLKEFLGYVKLWEETPPAIRAAESVHAGNPWNEITRKMQVPALLSAQDRAKANLDEARARLQTTKRSVVHYQEMLEKAIDAESEGYDEVQEKLAIYVKACDAGK